MERSVALARTIIAAGVVGLGLTAGCAPATHGTPPVATAAEVQAPEPVERGAVGDGDLRMMIAEMASAKACEMVRGQFRPLHAPDRPNIVTGDMWIRECKITHDGTKVTFVLSGNGWQWAEQEQKKAGGTFKIKQYVKFEMTATLTGALDIAYDQNAHILSLWFTPEKLPDVTFKPIGDITVDRKGAWSSVVGALGSLFAKSPERLAQGQAKEQGDHELQKQLSDGLSVTINLCSGLSRFGLGREPKGKMDVPEAGETKNVPVEMQTDSLMVFGPQIVGPAGYTASVESSGLMHVALACKDQADLVAAAYADGKPLPVIKTLAAQDVQGKATLHIAKAACPVSMIAQQIMPNVPAVTFDWQRPPAEIARSTGGPIIACGHAEKPAGK